MLAAIPTAFQIEGFEWLILLSLFVVFLAVGIVGATSVYGDAQIRGMNGGAWAVAMVLATFLLLGLGGLLILGLYLAERNKHPVLLMPYPPARYFAPGPASYYPCHVCQAPLQWAPAHGRWWCPRCGQYR